MNHQSRDSFNTRSTLTVVAGRKFTFFDLAALERHGYGGVAQLPFTVKIFLENLLRHEDELLFTADMIAALANWKPQAAENAEMPFMPARILLQDFTGVPALADLAAMRDAARRLYDDPARINPVVPAELVIDHSVQVDAFGSQAAFTINEARDYERNHERYAFLRWGQRNFQNFQVVPPATGICHQVNLEYLARVVFVKQQGDIAMAFPDSLVGLDSHTTMINGLGVPGWGVGGIEAEAVMLGRPYYLLTPQVIGFKLTGRRPEGVTATDLVLYITEILRKHGVVGKFVEFYGTGLSSLSLEDRATIANMAPEYGATMGFFPVDDQTLRYLRLTGRSAASVALVESYCKAQGLFRTDTTPDPQFTETLALDMARVGPCLAGPRRPQDRINLADAPASLQSTLQKDADSAGLAAIELDGQRVNLKHGAVVIAAITSCTNTSNPSVLLAAGLLARNAVARGLAVKPWVKTSLAPGSKVVTTYLKKAGLLAALEKLSFHLVAYGCTTCIGNSGPLPQPITEAITRHNLNVAAVLSGNRNFEGRINPLTRLNYLASPPLVVAYALAGTMDIDFTTQPLGRDTSGQPVFLRDIWPSDDEIQKLMARVVEAQMYQIEYREIYTGSKRWQALPVPEGALYAWDPDSTYIKAPPFFQDITADVPALEDIRGARVLALLGDSVTTDHISPAGAIPVDSPAGRYLVKMGVEPVDFNSYGARRGNHDVMLRGTFGNIRLQNQLAPGTTGGRTLQLPEKRPVWLYDAAMHYQAQRVPLLVIAGREYGTGSSRDWAAKGTHLLGVKAVLAESFERIHRSNLVCMGVLPLQFQGGQNCQHLGLDGTESYSITGIAESLAPGKLLAITARRDDGREIQFEAVARLDSPVELTYYRHGGILPFVLRAMGGTT